MTNEGNRCIPIWRYLFPKKKSTPQSKPATIPVSESQVKRARFSFSTLPRFLKCSVLVATGFFFAIVCIASSTLNPFGTNPNSDEYIYTAAAKYILAAHVCQPYDLWEPVQSLKLCNLEHPPLVKEFMAASMLLLGENVWGARLPSILFGTLCVPLVAYISWMLVGNEIVAALSAILMATDPLLIGVSSIALLDTAEIFFSLCAIALFLSSSMRSHPYWKQLAIGGLFGLSILSKEVGVFALLALATYYLFCSRIFTAVRRTALMMTGAVATVAVGFQTYDHYFTVFPNFVNHIEFILSYAASIHGYYVSTNPDLWLTSLSARDLSSGLGVLNPVISLPVFIWLLLIPIYVLSRRSVYALTLPAVLFFWTYIPYFVVFDYLHRDVKYFYSIQMSPALVLGAAYLYWKVGERFPLRSLANNKKLLATIAVSAVSVTVLVHFWLAPKPVITEATYQFPTMPFPYGKYGLTSNGTGVVNPSLDLYKPSLFDTI
jgi:4-amino-4-deoxy-L-arabinose transferase-like glycosyltransferase